MALAGSATRRLRHAGCHRSTGGGKTGAPSRSRTTGSAWKRRPYLSPESHQGGPSTIHGRLKLRIGVLPSGDESLI